MDNKLEEGRKYPFKILNKVTLPGSGEGNFILLGPDKKKYLLPEGPFKNYGIKINNILSCTVDKINCSGKVFLEPDHPYYRVGERYDFMVTRLGEQKNVLGESQPIAWVRDLHALEWACPVVSGEGIEPGISHLACRIERIKKGELFLSLPAMTSRFKLLKPGKRYSFRITNVKTFEQGEYYILSGPQGNLHRILVDYYRHYGFIKGKEIMATVIKVASSGEYVLEPDNPNYKAGNTYSFKFLSMELSEDFLGNPEAVITVQDGFNLPVKAKPLEWQLKIDNYQPESLKCRVDRIKKGRLHLTITESPS